jgi:hypothetical protein
MTGSYFFNAINDSLTDFEPKRILYKSSFRTKMDFVPKRILYKNSFCTKTVFLPERFLYQDGFRTKNGICAIQEQKWNESFCTKSIFTYFLIIVEFCTKTGLALKTNFAGQTKLYEIRFCGTIFIHILKILFSTRRKGRVRISDPFRSDRCSSSTSLLGRAVLEGDFQSATDCSGKENGALEYGRRRRHQK